MLGIIHTLFRLYHLTSQNIVPLVFFWQGLVAVRVSWLPTCVEVRGAHLRVGASQRHCFFRRFARDSHDTFLGRMSSHRGCDEITKVSDETTTQEIDGNHPGG